MKHPEDKTIKIRHELQMCISNQEVKTEKKLSNSHDTFYKLSLKPQTIT